MISSKVIDDEPERQSNTDPDKEICDHTDNEIENRNDPKNDFEEQVAIDSKYKHDCSDEDYLGNTSVRSKSTTFGILPNKKSRRK